MTKLVHGWVRADGTRCRIVSNPESRTVSVYVGSASVTLLADELIRVAVDLEGPAWDDVSGEGSGLWSRVGRRQ